MLQTQEMWVQFLGQKDSLEKEMATHSTILALENSMDKEPWGAADHGVTKSHTRLGTHTQIMHAYRHASVCVSKNLWTWLHCCSVTQSCDMCT